MYWISQCMDAYFMLSVNEKPHLFHLHKFCWQNFKVLMKQKNSCSDYGFMVKNFENDSRTPFT